MKGIKQLNTDKNSEYYKLRSQGLSDQEARETIKRGANNE